MKMDQDSDRKQEWKRLCPKTCRKIQSLWMKLHKLVTLAYCHTVISVLSSYFAESSQNCWTEAKDVFVQIPILGFLSATVIFMAWQTPLLKSWYLELGCSHGEQHCICICDSIYKGGETVACTTVSVSSGRLQDAACLVSGLGLEIRLSKNPRQKIDGGSVGGGGGGGGGRVY